MRRPVAAVLAVVLVVLAGCAALPASDATAGSGGPAPDASASPTASVTPVTSTAPGGDGVLRMHFIDVGQAGAVLVVGPSNETMLVDSGDYTDDGASVLEYLRRHGVERIDYLVTSHADADHVGGHAAVIEYYETEADGVGAVYDPGVASSTRVYERYLDAVERHDVPLYRTEAGDGIPLAGATVRVLSPPPGYLADRDRNENSLVLRVERGSASALLPGDAGRAAEASLLAEYGPALNATVLYAGHHGSNDSTGPAFLDAVDPRTVVISSAYDSRYGHPHGELLDRLAARDLPTYWTATHGDVVVRTDGRRVSVLTAAAAPTAPADLREGAPAPPGASGGLVVRETYCVVADCGTRGPVTAEGPSASAGAPATPRETATATPETPRLELVEVRADAPGNDHENPNGEYLVLRNAGGEPLSLDGWVVADAAGHAYRFPEGTTLGPGARVTLYTGTGTDGESARYWGSATAVWDNDGDTVTVRTDGGRVVVREAYA